MNNIYTLREISSTAKTPWERFSGHAYKPILQHHNTPIVSSKEDITNSDDDDSNDAQIQVHRAQ